MRSFRSELIGKIRHYRLDQKKPPQTKTNTDWKQILVMAEYGMLSEGMARNYLHLIETDIEYLKDFPDFLHRLPDAEQLYANGRPHVRLGALADDPELELGIRFDGPLFMLCAGLTGFGKTTAVRILLKGIHEYNLRNPGKKVIVIVFDRKGGDYADLPAKFGWKHYHFYNSLRLSLENPKGMPPQVWINTLASLFCARAGLKYAWTTMASAIRTLLALLNPKPSQRLIWPDFQLVLDFLKALPDTEFSTKAEYTRSLKQQLEGISQSTFKTFNAFQGFRAEDLIAAGQSAVIAMPNIEPAWSRQLFTDIIISGVLKGRIERSERGDLTRILFVADEAGPDVNAEAEQSFSDHMCPFSELYKRGREFEIGACLSVGSLRTVSPLIRENATTQLMFRPSDARARAEAAATLMLPPYGELTFDHLKEGQCLVKQVGPWPHAMKGKIDYIPPSRIHVTKYDSHPFVASKRLWEIPSVKQFVDTRKAAYENKKTKKRKPDRESQLQQLSMKLLKLRASHPYMPVVRLFEKLGKFRFQIQIDVREILEESGFAEFEEIRIGSPKILLMDITAAGFKALGLPIPNENKGRGGITHRHFAHWIKFHFEKRGYKAYLERVIAGTNHPVDVAVESNNRLEIFEICVTASDNLVTHIEACFEKSDIVENLTIMVPTKTRAKELKKLIRSNLMFARYDDRIKVDIMENYMPKEI